MKNDQRVYKRRMPKRNIYAALGRYYEKVGKCINLSPGGMTFEYYSDGNECAKFSQVDLFEVGGVVNLRNLPCKIIYDITLPPARDGIESLKRSRNRRCGVEFKNLAKEDTAQLALFLESHTIEDN